MTDERMRHLAERAGEIAVAAGRAILDVYWRPDIEVLEKEDSSPLTEADLASHRIIRDALTNLTPDIPLLSEESADVDYAVRSQWREYWLVDPLDGTKEFVNRNDEFTVNIALIRDSEPVLGVVHVPVSGDTYSGIVGVGATRRAAGGKPQPIRVQRPCASPVRVVGSRSHASPKLKQFLEQLGDYRLVSMGSSLKFCLVAEGRADFYPRLGPTSEWDTAAAHAVVLGAGGRVVTLDGRALEYNRKSSYLNPEFLVIGDTDRDWLKLFRDYRA